MRGKYPWLVLPVAAALILFLGPLRARPTQPGKPVAASAPGTLEVLSTLAGVLCLGVVGVMVLARFTRRGRGAGAGGALALRESLRLSGRHALHLVQLEDRILLLGECDGRLAVLDRAQAEPQLAAEAELAAREAEPLEDGATPRDLVIPRPAAPMHKRPAEPKPLGTALADFQRLLAAARGVNTQATSSPAKPARMVADA
jgi:flagellar biogenesis protein FliO